MWRMRASEFDWRRAFTLVEVLVSITLLALMIVVLGQVTSGTSKIWRDSSDKISAFQGARAGLETMTQTLSQATLNTYFDYFDNTGARITPSLSVTAAAAYTPTAYGRYSELHFLSGPASQLLAGVVRRDKSGSHPYPDVTSGHAVFFQTATGFTSDTAARNLDNALNGVGYFVEFGSDKDFMPPLVSSKVAPRYRYRLVQMVQPAEKLQVYSENWALRNKGTKAAWFATPLNQEVAGATDPRPTQVLAENVILMALTPKRSDQEYAAAAQKPKPIAPNYVFDSQPQAVIPPSGFSDFPSRHQLPPLIGVTLVAIDEASAIRWQSQFGDRPPLAELGLDSLFQNTTDTNDPGKFEDDLLALKEKLAELKINYRVFDTELIIRSSKWSQD